MDEDAPNYRTIIQNPMDMATLLLHVDSGKYITCKAFLEDFDLILINAKVCAVMQFLIEICLCLIHGVCV